METLNKLIELERAVKRLNKDVSVLQKKIAMILLRKPKTYEQIKKDLVLYLKEHGISLEEVCYTHPTGDVMKARNEALYNMFMDQKMDVSIVAEILGKKETTVRNYIKMHRNRMISEGKGHEL